MCVSELAAVCTHVWIWGCVCVCVRWIFICTLLFVRVYACGCVFVHASVCVFVLSLLFMRVCANGCVFL